MRFKRRPAGVVGVHGVAVLGRAGADRRVVTEGESAAVVVAAGEVLADHVGEHDAGRWAGGRVRWRAGDEGVAEGDEPRGGGREVKLHGKADP